MIKSFDKQNLQNLRRDLDSAFLQVQQKYGVRIQLGTIRFDTNEARGRLTMTAVGDAKTAADPRAAQIAKMAADFKLDCTSFGLKPEQYGATFTYGRETYKLVGLNLRARKRPVTGQSLTNGGLYGFPENAINSLQDSKVGLFGSQINRAPEGKCSNDQAWEVVNGKYTEIGQCKRTATTTRKGIGRDSRPMPYCDDCARNIDDSRAEMEAEARANR